ncbi:MAG TPA: hypothetical protein VEB21_00135, partial [Terriglobales bacterium]|nr:hypothetical protein [Terriglobales bacterium]
MLSHAVEQLRSASDIDAEDLAALVDCLGVGTLALRRRVSDTLRLLAEKGVAVDHVLASVVQSPCERLRWGAAFTSARLGILSDPVRDVLIAALASDQSDVRWAAASVVANSGEPGSMLPRLQAAAASPRPVQRKMALYCLRDLCASDDETLKAIEATLADDDVHVRLAALAAMASCCRDTNRTLVAIRTALSDRSPQLRRAAL